jgi:hypothetical protein
MDVEPWLLLLPWGICHYRITLPQWPLTAAVHGIGIKPKTQTAHKQSADAHRQLS